mmetsp:Transcript_16500/g.32028  ORF Transcript_16500/g.32028 Transcript_16500/m.32028 type:complete len:103 (+) Transcript_16500:2071-2379(+)
MLKFGFLFSSSRILDVARYCQVYGVYMSFIWREMRLLFTLVWGNSRSGLIALKPTATVHSAMAIGILMMGLVEKVFLVKLNKALRYPDSQAKRGLDATVSSH